MVIKNGILTVTYYNNSQSVNDFLRENAYTYTIRFVTSRFYGTEFSITIPKGRTKADKEKKQLLLDFIKS